MIKRQRSLTDQWAAATIMAFVFLLWLVFGKGWALVISGAWVELENPIISWAPVGHEVVRTVAFKKLDGTLLTLLILFLFLIPLPALLYCGEQWWQCMQHSRWLQKRTILYQDPKKIMLRKTEAEHLSCDPRDALQVSSGYSKNERDLLIPTKSYKDNAKAS